MCSDLGRTQVPSPCPLLHEWPKELGVAESHPDPSPKPGTFLSAQPSAAWLMACVPTDETLYEAEPIFTSNSSCSGLGGCHLFLSTVPVLWTLLGS